jgi:hypothetical protein
MIWIDFFYLRLKNLLDQLGVRTMLECSGVVIGLERATGWANRACVIEANGVALASI